MSDRLKKEIHERCEHIWGCRNSQGQAMEAIFFLIVDELAKGHQTGEGEEEKRILRRLLALAENTNEKINMITQAELATGLKAIQAQVGKVATEQSNRFDTLTKEFQDLKDSIVAGGMVTPEVETALADVKTALQSLDDVIPDAPGTPA